MAGYRAPLPPRLPKDHWSSRVDLIGPLQPSESASTIRVFESERETPPGASNTPAPPEVEPPPHMTIDVPSPRVETTPLPDGVDVQEQRRPDVAHVQEERREVGDEADDEFEIETLIYRLARSGSRAMPTVSRPRTLSARARAVAARLSQVLSSRDRSA
jgi:hypothetical protein